MKIQFILFSFLIVSCSYGQVGDVSIILKSEKNGPTKTLCIKSQPRTGSPFTSFEKALYGNIESRNRHGYYDYKHQDSLGNEVNRHLFASDLNKLDLHVSYDAENIEFDVDSFSLIFEKEQGLHRPRLLHGLIFKQENDLAYHVSDYTFLLRKSFPQLFDSVLLRRVYENILSVDSKPKYDGRLNEIPSLTKKDLFEEIDTFTVACYGGYEERMIINTTFYSYNDLNLDYIFNAGYDVESNSFTLEISYLGLSLKKIDVDTGIFKYYKPLGYINREDLLTVH